MCGIVGFCGQDTSGSEIFRSLQQLEYRGYDSSGITVINERGIESIKSSGRLGKIESKANGLSGNVGIGHTRWATHGEANDRNAHPHASEHLALVHNGIIENYLDIKAKLPQVQWRSETDSETILHLLEAALAAGASVFEAILQVVNELHGTFTIAVVSKNEPEVIYAVKRELPLAIGIGDKRHMIASDILAMPSDCRMIAHIPEDSVVRISAETCEAWDFIGSKRTLDFQPYQSAPDAAQLGAHQHFMIKEIKEQPDILQRILAGSVNFESMDLNDDLTGVKGLNLGKINHIQIVGCGSAFHAGILGKYYLEMFSQIPVTVELASEFRYSDRPLTAKTLIIALSQSGETADTLSCVSKAVAAGCQILAFCNRPHAEIPRIATKTIPLDCGPEISVASTKAFTAMILRLYLFALSYGRNRGQIKREDFKQRLSSLRMLPAHVRKVIVDEPSVRDLAIDLSTAKTVFFLGRRLSYPIALEGSLKLKEISYIQAEGYAAGELKHGPLALIERDTPVIAIAPRDRFYQKTLSNLAETKARGARVISVTAPGSDIAEQDDETIALPDMNEDLFPIAAVVVVQLLSYHAAKHLGHDIDKPRNLAKSVTVE